MDIYREAIEKAVENGYKYLDAFDKDWWEIQDCGKEGVFLNWGDSYGMMEISIERILFDHAFWKKLLKDHPLNLYEDDWIWSFVEFALSTDREAYLKDLLKSMEDNEKESKNKR